jgi:hypothetical protein
MKTNHSMALGALALMQTLFFLETAHAAEYSFSDTLDLSQSPAVISGSSDQLDNFYFSGSLPSFDLETGDTISGTITFANNQLLTLTGNPSATDYYLSLLFPTAASSTYLTGLSSVTLLGVTGSLTSPNPDAYETGPGNSILAAEDSGISTASSFSFTGFSYSVTLTSSQAVSDVSPSYVQLGQIGSNANFLTVSDAPEPSAWALMACGIGVLVGLCRGRRINAAFVQ